MTASGEHPAFYDGQPVTRLVHHIDADGDLLRMFHDPGGDATEDIWIGVTDLATGHTNAVRIPKAMLVAALS